MALTDYTIPPVLRSRQGRSAVNVSVQEIMTECYRNYALFCKTFMPERFDQRYTSLHYQVTDAINETLREQRLRLAQGRHPGMRLAIKGSRGTAKSSFCTYGLPAYRTFYGESNFVVPITKTEGNSILQTENLRRKMQSDPKIRKYFGDVRLQGMDEDMEAVFGKKAWIAGVAGNKTMILPRGAGQQVRGLSFGIEGFRPDLFAVDDFDDDKWLLNEELRNYYHNTWFKGAVLYAVSQFEAEMVPWLIVVMDSCKHEAALIEKLSAKPEWNPVVIKVCDEDYKTLAPDFMSQERLDAEIKEAREDGTLDVLARELMSVPAATEGKPFLHRYFQHFKEDTKFLSPQMISFVMGDPAHTISATSDYSAVVGATIDLEEHKIYFREALRWRCQPHEFIKNCFDMALRIGAYHVGIELNGPKLHLENNVRNYIASHGLYSIGFLELEPQRGKGEQSHYLKGKPGFITWALAGYYSNMRVYHHPKLCNILETELLANPRGQHDDVANAAAYLPQMMEKLGIHFHIKDIPFESQVHNLGHMPTYDERTIAREARKQMQSKKKQHKLTYAELDDIITREEYLQESLVGSSYFVPDDLNYYGVN